MAKNRAGRLVVDVAMTFPMNDIDIRHMIWMLLSPVRPEVYVTTSETRKVPIHTGAVISNVAILPYPSVLTIEGKKYWNVCERSDEC